MASSGAPASSAAWPTARASATGPAAWPTASAAGEPAAPPGQAGCKVPRSIEGQVACDWKRSLAFAPYGQLSGNIFLNPRAAAHASVAERAGTEVVAACLAAADPETGAPLFADAFLVADRYGLDPAAEGMPDVLALSADGYQASAKWNPLRDDLLRPDPNLPATHFREGVLAIDAPDVRPGHHLSADLHDVAPTALALLGLRIPEGMEGRPIQEAFEDPAADPLRRPPLHRIRPRTRRPARRRRLRRRVRLRT